jgi:hypothetical protein
MWWCCDRGRRLYWPTHRGPHHCQAQVTDFPCLQHLRVCDAAHTLVCVQQHLNGGVRGTTGAKAPGQICNARKGGGGSGNVVHRLAGGWPSPLHHHPEAAWHGLKPLELRRCVQVRARVCVFVCDGGRQPPGAPAGGAAAPPPPPPTTTTPKAPTPGEELVTGCVRTKARVRGPKARCGHLTVLRNIEVRVSHPGRI